MLKSKVKCNTYFIKKLPLFFNVNHFLFIYTKFEHLEYIIMNFSLIINEINLNNYELISKALIFKVLL